MKMRNLLAAALAGLVAAGCGGGDADGNRAAANAAGGADKAERSETSVGDALAASVDHSTFVEQLQAAGLIETLRGVGPYTVFAPTNAAFDAVPEDVRNRLATADQRERLIALLSYHIVQGTVTADDLRAAIDRPPEGRAELATVTGDNLTLSRDGEAVLVGDASGTLARIARADQLQANGVVHSIDAVLMPGD